MILTKLSLTDFGVFQGQQTFNLAPRQGKPIVLFGGKNGAGKSTILEAIRLCLYGFLALDSVPSKDAYAGFLGRRIHSSPALLIQPTFSRVALEFQYGELGEVHTFHVSRSWEQRGSHRLQEQLELNRDGKPLDEVSEEHWQDFVRDMIPAGISQLFFFDGEKIQKLAEDTTDKATLADSIKSLLGLDLVDRLQTDIGIYLSRQTKSQLSPSGAQDLEALEQEQSRLQRQLESAQDRRNTFKQQLGDLEERIRRVEGQITSAGGGFAQQRDGLIRQQATLKAKISQGETQLREWCNGLLPFALVPHLCEEVNRQLQQEASQAEWEAGSRLLQQAQTQFFKQVESPPFWKAFPEIKAPLKNKLQHALKKAVTSWDTSTTVKKVPSVQGTSPSESYQLSLWITQATQDLPQAVKALRKDLEEAYRELERVGRALRKIPADEVLIPLLAELQTLHLQQAEMTKNILAAEEEKKVTTLEIERTAKQYHQTLEKLAQQTSQQGNIELAQRVQGVLSEYYASLLHKKIHELEEAVTLSFQVLCRKKDMLRNISIDPKDFSVTLYNGQGRSLPKAHLSAGEKQIYAISMLWALGKISGRPLPIIIDTPLARLDLDHRQLLLTQYFPYASHQVLILSTDTEIDQSSFKQLRPALSHSYRLEFDSTEHATKVSSGYWWNGAHET